MDIDIYVRYPFSIFTFILYRYITFALGSQQPPWAGLCGDSTSASQPQDVAVTSSGGLINGKWPLACQTYIPST